MSDLLVFNEQAHQYRYDGQPVPSVTEILKETGLVDTRWYKPDTASRGTDVHIACQLYDLFGIDADNSSEIAEYLTAWKGWLEATKVSIKASELPVFSSEHWFAGTTDRVVTYRGIDTIIDIKTGGKADWHKLQVAAYGLAYGAYAGGVVYLRPTGTFNFFYINTVEFEVLKKQFAALVNFYHEEREKR